MCILTHQRNREKMPAYVGDVYADLGVYSENKKQRELYIVGQRWWLTHNGGLASPRLSAD